jgi:hypothetical protein
MHRLGVAAIVAFGIALVGSTVANAQSVMKQCGEQWQTAKQAGTTNGETWPQFLKDCRARMASTSSAPAQGGFAPSAPAPAPAQPQSGSLFPWQQPATQRPRTPHEIGPINPDPSLRRRLNIAVRARQLSGSTRTHTSITSPERGTMATRSEERTCARQTLRARLEITFLDLRALRGVA